VLDWQKLLSGLGSFFSFFFPLPRDLDHGGSNPSSSMPSFLGNSSYFFFYLFCISLSLNAAAALGLLFTWSHKKDIKHSYRSHGRRDSMSKLAPSLKALINAPFARPDPTAASARILDVYKAIASDAAKHRLGLKPWLALSVCFSPLSPLMLNKMNA
jgi:hypothetical protein